ncbi:MAG: pilus assembly protein TadG-related protein [Elusimicrobiota bacterium]
MFIKKIRKTIKKIVKQEEGQTIALSVLTLFSLIVFWLLVVNMGRLVSARIQVTNAADSAAQSAATIRARALNLLGGCNFVIASLLSPISGSPGLVWYPMPFNDTTTPKIIKAAVEVFTKANTSLDITDVIHKVFAETGDEIAGIYAAWESGAIAYPNKAKDLNLKKKEGIIIYCGTITIPYFPFIAPIPLEYGTGFPDCESWYYMEDEDEDKFADMRQKWTAYKSYDKIGTDIFGTNIDVKEVGFDIWGIITGRISISDFFGDFIFDVKAIASARPYNKKGPMFPEKKGRDFFVTYKPIIRYLKARKGGWYAQLIPLSEEEAEEIDGEPQH